MRITVAQFQDLYKISESPLDDIEKSSMMLMVLTNKSKNEIENLSLKKYNRLCAMTKRLLDLELIANDSRKPVKFLKANGTIYQLHYDITRMDAGRYVEGVTFSEDPVGNMHKILASMAVPMRWTWKGIRAQPYDSNRHEQVAEDMKHADFSAAYHAMVFFYAVLNGLMTNLATSGRTAEEDLVARLQRLSLKYLDGSITAKWYQNLKGLA